MTRNLSFAVSRDGTHIAYEQHGEGPAVLLLHGFSETGASWTQAGYTDALLALGYRVVLIDARGHGASGRPTDADSYAGPHRLADLAAVLDALDLPRAAFMGFSMGGVGALAAAAFLPERVSAAIALGAHPFAEDLGWLRDLLSGGMAGWLSAVDAAVGGIDPESRRRIAGNDIAALRASVARDRPDFAGRLAASGRPVLALLGDRDPRYRAAEALARLPATEVLTLHGVDHFGTFLASRDRMSEIAAFLSRISKERD